MRIPIQFANPFIRNTLMIVGLLVTCSGCQGGFGRNINPYAAYGSPRIAPPATGAVGTGVNPGNGADRATNSTSPVGSSITSNQPATQPNGGTTNPNASTYPYYSGNASYGDTYNRGTYGNSTTPSVPATPTSGDRGWHRVNPSSSLPQSRIPAQGTSTQGGSSGARPYTAAIDASPDPYESQVAPASYNQTIPGPGSPDSSANVNALLNGMRVNDATSQSTPRAMPTAEDARPLTNSPSHQSSVTPHDAAPSNGQPSWSSSELNSLSQQPSSTPSSQVNGLSNTAAERAISQEEFAAFVQGTAPRVLPSDAASQSVAVVTTLPTAAALDPSAPLRSGNSTASGSMHVESNGWRTRDE